MIIIAKKDIVREILNDAFIYIRFISRQNGSGNE